MHPSISRNRETSITPQGAAGEAREEGSFRSIGAGLATAIPKSGAGIAKREVDMKITGIKTLNGANGYCDAPVLVMTLEMEELAGKETHEVTGFMNQLLMLLPDIKHHHCVTGRTGALIETTRAALGFGHITARVALTLANLAGSPVHYASALHPEGPKQGLIIIEFVHEMAMRYLLKTAVEVVEAISNGKTPLLEAKLNEARDLIRRAERVSSQRAVVGNASRWS
jgi:cyanophycin synthetase